MLNELNNTHFKPHGYPWGLIKKKGEIMASLDKEYYKPFLSQYVNVASYDVIIWSEDLAKMSVKVCPEGYTPPIINSNILNGGLIITSDNPEVPIFAERVYCNLVTNEIYLSENSFNEHWSSIAKSIDMVIKYDKNCSIKNPKHIVDLNLLNNSIKSARIKHDKIEYDNIVEITSGMRLALSPNIYFYDNEHIYVHDYTCCKINGANKKVLAASSMPSGKRLCNYCKKHLALRSACMPRLDLIEMADKFLFSFPEINDNTIAHYFLNNIKIIDATVCSLTLFKNEDTFVIKKQDNDLALWHNNYVMTADNSRHITEGYHPQKVNSNNILTYLNNIESYTWAGHLESKGAINEESAEVITTTEKVLNPKELIKVTEITKPATKTTTKKVQKTATKAKKRKPTSKLGLLNKLKQFLQKPTAHKSVINTKKPNKKTIVSNQDLRNVINDFIARKEMFEYNTEKSQNVIERAAIKSKVRELKRCISQLEQLLQESES